MDDESVLWEETIEPGATWSHVLKRGTSLRIVDLEGGANVGAIFYNFECSAERYNKADTQGPAHRPANRGMRVVFGYGPDPVFANQGHSRMARSHQRMLRRGAGA